MRLAALVGYVFLALAFTWPLVLHLDSHLTGPVGGDTGVYVWNQWVFRHEVLNERLPLFTQEIFSFSRPANLSLHNYTIFQDLLALPLLGHLGVVTTFNVVYLMMIVITGYATFRLAFHVTRRPFESWLAGALFSWSPYLVTRGMGHFSLVAAAPLPVFALLLLDRDGRASVRNAVALGATVCWAATTDPYYAVYCVMLGCLFVASQAIHIARDPSQPSTVPRTLDVLLACVAGFAISLVMSGGWQISVLGRRVSTHGLYTPMLLLTVLAVVRAAWPYRRAALSIDRTEILRFVRIASVAVPVSVLILSPVLYAVGVRIMDTGFESSPIRWRSSPPGVDVVSFFLPNPNHPLAPEAIRAWLTPRPDQYIENVASIPLVALIVIGVAIGARWRPSRIWIAVTAAFGLLALGPFVHVAGFNTHIPGPWAFARYIPIIGLARTPARVSIVVMLGVSMLFAAASSHLGDRWPRRRRLLLSAITLALLFELSPVPRPLYSASVPAFYTRVALDPRDVTLMELPVGVRDGTSSVGDFTARSQFFQTVHGKPLVGGYLSRVSRKRIAQLRQDPLLDALITLSEGGNLDGVREAALVERGDEFIRRGRLGYVVIDNDRTPPPLRNFAVRTLHLRHVAAEGSYDLFVPASFGD
ncbi:MAG TPA: hypothetical protein VFU28_20295 [Vicinamibacterales bacterium]|nr:hypothetical protein [Vicinamibacterales bacterium]